MKVIGRNPESDPGPESIPGAPSAVRYTVNEIDQGWDLARQDLLRGPCSMLRGVRMALQMADSYQRLRARLYPMPEPWHPTPETPQLDFYEAVVDSLWSARRYLESKGIDETDLEP